MSREKAEMTRCERTNDRESGSLQPIRQRLRTV